MVNLASEFLGRGGAIFLKEMMEESWVEESWGQAKTFFDSILRSEQTQSLSR